MRKIQGLCEIMKSGGRYKKSKLHRPWWVRDVRMKHILKTRYIIFGRWFSRKASVVEVQDVLMVGKRTNGSGVYEWCEVDFTGNEWVFINRQFANKFKQQLCKSPIETN